MLFRLSFEIKDGYLIHTASKKCARPVGSLVDGVQLGLYSSCAGHKFGFTKLGSLQHISSKKCVNPSSGVSFKMSCTLCVGTGEWKTAICLDLGICRTCHKIVCLAKISEKSCFPILPLN